MIWKILNLSKIKKLFLINSIIKKYHEILDFTFKIINKFDM